MHKLSGVCIAAVMVVACGEVKNDGDDAIDAPIGDAPNAPTGVTAMANIALGARLSWTAPTVGGTVTEYTVTPTPAGGTVKIAGTQAIVSGLTAGTSYTFTVTAKNPNGTGPASDPSSAVAIVTGPAVPAGLVACAADGSTTLSPTSVLGAVSYNIYFDTAPGVTKLSASKVTSATLPVSHARANGEKLYYVATAVDAAGIESDDSVEDSATPDPAVHDTVFTQSFSVSAIEILDCFSRYTSTSRPISRKLVGAATTIVATDYNGIAVDPARALIYYRNADRILVFSNATRTNGNVAPVRTIASASLTGGRGIALDATRDLLYVVNAGTVLVFANASTATGAPAPARTIASADLTSVFALASDATNDRLYVANAANALVFNTASTANGAPAAARKIAITGVSSNFGVAVDVTNDVLYMSARNSASIYSVAASTANGTVAPLRVISGRSQPIGIATGANRLLEFNDSAVAVASWTTANTVNGAVAPNVTLPLPTLIQGSGLAYAP